MDIGLTDYTARKWMRTVSPRPMAPTQIVQVSHLGLADTVALVPMGEVGRRYLRHGVYIRDMQLRGQMRLRATHLGWSDHGEVTFVRPVTRRWRIGSAAAIPATGVANLSAITSELDLLDNWAGPATLIELGDPIPVGLPLGSLPIRPEERRHSWRAPRPAERATRSSAHRPHPRRNTIGVRAGADWE